MNVFPIVLDDGIVWKLFSEDYSLQEGRYVAKILFEVRYVFIETFGTHTVNSHPVLGVLPTRGDPQTERSNSIIFISQKAPQYIHYIYQFAHELCHFMVPGEVCQSFRWFEETICQMMSWYAMKFLYCFRSKRAPLYPGLYDAIPRFIRDTQASRTPIKGQSLSDFIRSNLSHLQTDCYDRPMNRAIGHELYPMFCETPDLWKIVPYLNTLTDDMLLVEWIAGLLGTIGVEKSRGYQLIKVLTK